MTEFQWRKKPLNFKYFIPQRFSIENVSDGNIVLKSSSLRWTIRVSVSCLPPLQNVNYIIHSEHERNITIFFFQKNHFFCFCLFIYNIPRIVFLFLLFYATQYIPSYQLCIIISSPPLWVFFSSLYLSLYDHIPYLSDRCFTLVHYGVKLCKLDITVNIHFRCTKVFYFWTLFRISCDSFH